MSGGKNRVESESCFILHSHPWKETSLILDVFSREHGRVALVARGARRPHSQLRGLLMAFQPLELSWFGTGEVRTLAKAEWVGGQPLLTGQPLMVGYYLNELLIRLVPRDDGHPVLFDAYAEVVRRLAGGPGTPDTVDLRRFELILLRELGYGVQLEHEADTGAEVLPEARYVFAPERGLVRVLQGEEGGPAVSGRTLLALARDDYSDPATLLQARSLMRQLIAHLLGGLPLHSRRVFMDMQET